jgi:hypothetical protein
MTKKVTVHGDLEAAFAAAHALALDAIGDADAGPATWHRQLAAAHRAVAEVYATARDSIPPGGLVWHAIDEAAHCRRDRAKNLDHLADQHEQEGTSR